MKDTVEKFENDSILYELLEYFVKKQDPELIRWKADDTGILSTTGTIKNALRYLNNRYSLPESISQQISLTIPWKLAIDESGRHLALLQENYIEFRKSKDEFSTVIGKASISKDAFPQWRKLSWSPDGTLLVLASSNGCLSFYNSLCNNIFNIKPKSISQNPEILEAGDAISSLIFTSTSKENEKWSYELLVVTYSGLLKSYNISCTHGFKKNYEFSFGTFYRKGVNAFAYDKKHNIYIVAGNSMSQNNLVSQAVNNGLTSWRALNDYPYFKLSFTLEENSLSSASASLSLWNLIPTFRALPDSVIFRISISPSCDNVVCLHTDGSISLWDLPSLKLRKKWILSDQSAYDIHNPLGLRNLKKLPSGFSEFHPVDIGWWSDHTIIIARYSGAVSVCSMNDLTNLLGSSPEFFYGQPQISEFNSEKGFLILDCESYVTSKKRKRTPSQDGSLSDNSDSDNDEDELDKITLLDYTINLIKGMLYSITDIERFQPKRKKTKILQRTYRILGIKSTTPEELYARKIDIEEYEDALDLANTYNLDTDLVYQTQWRKSEFSLDAITEHLSKVSKTFWVLEECIMRVPKTLEAARELLNFGLRGTDYETLLALLSDENDLQSERTDETDENNAQKRHEFLTDLDPSKFTESPKKLINYRIKLLNHADKLKTYEIIIGNNQMNYNKEFYESFRRLSIIENAVKFAKDGDYRAVEIMFTYHGSKLMPHWLGIMNHFPETLNPMEYEKLLPQCDDDGQLYLLYQREHRPKDWSENLIFEEIIDKELTDESSIIYYSNPQLSVYNTTELTMNLLIKWYTDRAYQIERDSGIIDNALEFIKIAREKNIIEIENLLIDLETLQTLVYELDFEKMSLVQLEKLSDFEKIQLFMSKTSEDNFISDIKYYIIPFLQKKKDYLGLEMEKHLFKNYLINLSQDDLTLPAIFFYNLTQDIELFDIVDDITSLALDCLYACTNPISMFIKAREIFDSISKLHVSASNDNSPLNELDKEIKCLKILNKYEINVTIGFIHDSKTDPEQVKIIFNEMTDALIENKTSLSTQNFWTELLNDILEIQGFIFSCVEIAVCLEIYVAAKLLSGVKSNIENCKSFIIPSAKMRQEASLKVPYKRAVDLILEASREYFNSSKSLYDSPMELSKACLNLIQDENELINEELDLINSLNILNEFNVNILPLQIRNYQDKLKLLQLCLNNSEGGYKKQQRLLTLASYLHIEDNNEKKREGKVLELVAIKAFDSGDFSASAKFCQQLIKNSYYPAWKIIKKLAFSDNYNDMEFKKLCCWFIVTHGPSEILEETLKQIHSIEIQLLNKNLKYWIEPNEFNEAGGNNDDDSEKAEDEDSEDNFTDAMTSPKIEVMEFIPKIIETSNELVKNSGQIFKESMDILTSVSNRRFWKTLQSNEAADIWQNAYEPFGNFMSERSRGELQSFPSFYQSLHENSLISRIDTFYSDYSKPVMDNTKFNISQSLLRIILLNETASYGLETSDINHFLTKSCGDVLADDWLLGVSYLLNLREKTLDFHVDKAFESLPVTNMYIQTCIYVHALCNYSRILYDPFELMKISVKESVNVSENDSVKKSIIYWYKKLNESFLANDEVKSESKNGDSVIEGSNKEVEVEEIIKNDNEVDDAGKFEFKDSGWDEEIDKNEDFNDNKIETIVDKAVPKESCENEWDTDWDNCWEDPVDDENDENNENPQKSLNSSENEELKNEDEILLPDDSTEEKRFNIFEELFADIENNDNYVKIKENLKKWPAFHESRFNCADRHPVLRMIERAASSGKNVVSKKYPECETAAIVEEYRDLLKGQSISPDVFRQFIEKFDKKISPNEKIFLRLSTNDSKFHAEAVDLMKASDNYEFPVPILEEIFFKDLSSSFPPHHPIYNKVIENIFLNHDLSQVESNFKLLIKKLMEQQHITYAIALWNQLAAVPPALSTFESSIQLFMKEWPL